MCSGEPSTEGKDNPEDPRKLPQASMGSHLYGLTSSQEQLWRNEVLYLHSLWHEGPPNRNHKPNSNNLHVSNSTTFKKESKKKKKNERNARKKKDSNLPTVSDVEWPCEPPPEPQSEMGWPELKPQSIQPTRPASAEEQAKFAALQLQQNGLKACQDFFSGKIDLDNEGEDEEEEDLMNSESDESEELNFFLGIFTEDNDLRSYYEKNYEGGEFCCLVCGGIGKKVGKRFKNCVALVQHSRTISKTQRKRAHRGFGQAICRVLGWDFNRLPSIVLALDKPLGYSLAKNEQPEVGPKENNSGAPEEDLHVDVVDLVDDVGEINSKGKHDGDQIEDLRDKVVDCMIADKNEPMDLQVGSMKDDAIHQIDIHSETLDTMEADKGEEMDGTVSLKEDPAGN